MSECSLPATGKGEVSVQATLRRPVGLPCPSARRDHYTQPEAVDAMGLASGGKVRRIIVGLKY